MKKVYKYATGQEIPEGAVYLKTIVQKEIEFENRTKTDHIEYSHKYKDWKKCWLVWHYFLIELTTPSGEKGKRV